MHGRTLVGAVTTLLVLAGCGGDAAVRDASGRVVTAGPWSVFDLRPGDCIGDTSQVLGDVEEVPLVPCEDPHTAEVFAVVDHPGTEFPGFGEVAAFADRSCLGALERERGLSEVDAVSYLLPSEDGWAGGDRTIVCVLVQDAG